MPLDEAFAGLFDSRVAIEEADPQTVRSGLLAGERELVRGAAASRVTDFTAGRVCARRALAQLGGPDDTPILRTADRAPIWPEGFVGSITHTRSRCAAAIARASQLRAIGIDLEPSTPLKRGVLDKVCTAFEQRWLCQASDRELMQKVVFSAKEAVYKCQYPVTGKYLGFHAVQVEVNGDGFIATFREEAGDFRPGDVLLGRYRVVGDLIATACVLEAR